jgi:nucleoside-diphosphate-sugar epimerase
MKVFVIGGAGFLGRRVVRAMAARGHEVFSLDIVGGDLFADLGKQVHSQRLDLTRFEDVVAAMATHKPERVVNLSYMRENLPRPAMKLNVLGMDNCFEAARLCDVAHVVYSSSIAVNGSQHPYGPRPVKETDPPSPMKQYAVHKVFNEWQAKEYREKHGMVITGVRAAHVSGTDKLIGSVDHVQCVVMPALGRSVTLDYRDRMRCVIHGDDAGEVFARIALAGKPRHTLYNTGGQTLSLGELADRVRKLLPQADIRFEHQTGGEERSGAYLFDNSRLVEEFGVRYMPYDQRLAQMIDAVRRGSTLG